MNEVLTILNDRDMTAAQIAKELAWKETKVYLALVGLEARGKVEVLVTYTQDRRPTAYWSKCEVTV